MHTYAYIRITIRTHDKIDLYMHTYTYIRNNKSYAKRKVPQKSINLSCKHGARKFHKFGQYLPHPKREKRATILYTYMKREK